MRAQSSQELMRAAHSAAQAVAEGPFTPVVFERYEYIGGERGVRLGVPTETATGYAGICWTDRAALAKDAA